MSLDINVDAVTVHLVTKRANELRFDSEPRDAAGVARAASDAGDDVDYAFTDGHDAADKARLAIDAAAWALLSAQVCSDAARLAATGEGGK